MVGLGREMKGRGDHVLNGWFGSRDERVEGDHVLNGWAGREMKGGNHV